MDHQGSARRKPCYVVQNELVIALDLPQLRVEERRQVICSVAGVGVTYVEHIQALLERDSQDIIAAARKKQKAYRFRLQQGQVLTLPSVIHLAQLVAPMRQVGERILLGQEVGHRGWIENVRKPEPRIPFGHNRAIGLRAGESL